METVTLFVAWLGAEGLAISTIESYLAGLRHYRLMADPSCMFPSLQSPHMKVLLRGIKRVQAQQGSPPQVRLPITRSIMVRIKEQLAVDSSSYRNNLVWAACCMGFFGFLRCAEFLLPDGVQFDASVHLSLADIRLVQVEPQWYVEVRIKASKTDQFRRGAQVILGATGSSLCPVAALLRYLSMRGGAPGALFQQQDGCPLRRSMFVRLVQEAISAAGMQGSHFNGHSFRIGAASAASAAGVPETTIKILGRWRSMAYQQYIRPAAQELAQVSADLSGRTQEH